MKTSVDRLKDTLKTEYGITSLEQLEEMIQKSEGINLGIFTMPIKGEKDDEKEKLLIAKMKLYAVDLAMLYLAISISVTLWG